MLFIDVLFSFNETKLTTTNENIFLFIFKEKNKSNGTCNFNIIENISKIKRKIVPCIV
jgi:hypothetical protein